MRCGIPVVRLGADPGSVAGCEDSTDNPKCGFELGREQTPHLDKCLDELAPAPTMANGMAACSGCNCCRLDAGNVANSSHLLSAAQVAGRRAEKVSLTSHRNVTVCKILR